MSCSPSQSTCCTCATVNKAQYSCGSQKALPLTLFNTQLPYYGDIYLPTVTLPLLTVGTWYPLRSLASPCRAHLNLWLFLPTLCRQLGISAWLVTSFHVSGNNKPTQTWTQVNAVKSTLGYSWNSSKKCPFPPGCLT